MENLFTNLILDAGLLLVPLLFILLVEKKKIDLGKLGFRSDGFVKDAALCGKVFFALLIYSMLLSFIFHYLGMNDFQGVEEAIGGLIAANVFFVAYVIMVKPFLEEFFFRAFLVPRMGVIASSFLFGLGHVGYGSIGEIVGAVLLGGILAIAYRDSNRIMPNYFAHLLYNLVSISVMAGMA